ncbi:uncharacterized protein LOC120010183 [Tripterygium wilfordii]|uniref:uncharacterized protein LOC120010183 n=1 Tax=Tripterygium wilfordii TaxID=458696 RepID=UPI0018F7EC09|nr:uncharacterized protein LOC120010183 [Tripterygium wilfordii]
MKYPLISSNIVTIGFSLNCRMVELKVFDILFNKTMKPAPRRPMTRSSNRMKRTVQPKGCSGIMNLDSSDDEVLDNFMASFEGSLQGTAGRSGVVAGGGGGVASEGNTGGGGRAGNVKTRAGKA